MKRAFLTLLTVTLVAGLSGCCHDRMCRQKHGTGTAGALQASPTKCPKTCQNQSPRGRGRGNVCEEAFAPGPPSGSVSYPYYTTRGPRDFLDRDPMSIGP